jgi:hypothetical protein
VEEERVVGLGVLNEPVHGAQDVLLVVGQSDHILALVTKGLHQVVGHVLNIVDATSELALLAKVVDADQESLALAGTVGVLERVAVGCAMAEVLHALWRRRWGALTEVVLLVNILAAGEVCIEMWLVADSGAGAWRDGTLLGSIVLRRRLRVAAILRLLWWRRLLVSAVLLLLRRTAIVSILRLRWSVRVTAISLLRWTGLGQSLWGFNLLVAGY